MIRLHRVCIWLILVCPGLALAQEKEGVQIELFNGENLDGWQVTDCEVGIEDGVLVLKSGNGFVRSDHEYRDFVLDIEWQAVAESDWDSGIFFRAGLPPEGRPWPTRYQANLLEGQEGNVKGLTGAESPESQSLVRPGEWNQFRLTVVGSRAELEINGQPAWKAEGIKEQAGYIGLQAEVPKGGQFRFRNIRITELGYQPLFNGQDLAGWEGGGGEANACWQVSEGLLHCTGEPGPWLRSAAEYGDFNLRLDYKLAPGGNSGVFVHVPLDGAHQGSEQAGGGPSGVEVQILDDASPRYGDIQPYQFCGSVYGIAHAKHHVSRPAGRWNTLEVDCRGTHYRVMHNGVPIVDASQQELPELGNRQLRGFLGLQNHSEEVWFRNLRLSEAPVE